MRLSAENLSVERAGRRVLADVGFCVEAGQALFVLESATARATLESQRGTVIRLEAARDRLDALLKKDGVYDAATQLARAPQDAAYAAFVARQVELFDTLRRGVAEKRDILNRPSPRARPWSVR